MKDKSALYMLY
jgi:gag-polypeptide of LTR copia-type